MSTTAYRRMRIAIGGLVLLISTLVFADVGGWISAPLARVGLWPQFTPSLLASLQGLAWISAGALLVLGLTLLFGRVYCAMLCPLGVMMDLSAWLARRSGKKRRLPHVPGHPRLRLAVLALCIGGLLLGTALPLAFLDPYSLWGKISASTLRPLSAIANNGMAALGWSDPVKISPVAPITLGLAILLLVGFVALAIRRGRLWCNTLCPVGAALGLLSRFSLFRLEIAKSACVACSLCERTCPAQCIDFKNHRIDHSRCVMCFSCVSSCRRNGIALQRGRPRLESAAVGEAPAMGRVSMPPVGRRRILGALALAPTAALAAGAGQPRPDRKTPTLPPGARSLEHFRSRCTACHLCVTKCPDQVLRPAISEHGLGGFLQPFQDFHTSFCSYNCSNCSQVCPTGAIEPLTVEERRTVRTGVARLDEDLCVVKAKGTPCGACNEHCPTQAVHMVPWKDNLTLPKVEPELCIGCGGCEYICPVRPTRAIVVEGLRVHEEAEPVDRGVSNTVREIEDEFPF